MKQLIPLSESVQAIILGGILGDGSLKIHTNYKNARFSFRHSVKQKNYFFWKAKELREIAGKQSVWAQGKDGKDGWGGEKLRFQSSALPALTELYNLVHKKGEFRVSRHWLNKLTPLSLAIWWLDDGSLVSNSRKGVICTDGFKLEDVKILSKYLKVVWKIENSVHPVGRKNQYRLHIRSTEQLKKLLELILPYIKVEDTLPKVLLLYNDHQLQERWISEVSNKTGFPRSVVERQLGKKKHRWKNFR